LTRRIDAPARVDAMMRLALSSARRGEGLTHPNPSVGAVVFRGDQLLGRGRTRPPGGPHAEVVALADAERRYGAARVRGAAMAVTLEPCVFRGRTGPCTAAIIESGVARVYIGVRDPHERVAGRGLRALRAAGIEVSIGHLEEACRRHHRGFFSVCERGRPFVTLKLATSVDARIATRTGASRWISGPEARAFVHRLRARSDGVMVGSGTALADDPELSARRGERVVRTPARVLIDSRLRVPASARLYTRADAAGGGSAQTLVLAARGARGRRAIAATGARVIDVPRAGRHLDLDAALTALAEAGLTTVLVEGGGQLAAALLRADLVDEIHWILAPKLIGEDGRPALGALGVEALSDSPGLEIRRVSRLGDDVHIEATIVDARRGAGKTRGRTTRRGGR